MLIKVKILDVSCRDFNYKKYNDIVGKIGTTKVYGSSFNSGWNYANIIFDDGELLPFSDVKFKIL